MNGAAYTYPNQDALNGNLVDSRAVWYNASGAQGGYVYDVLFRTEQRDSTYVGGDLTKTPAANDNYSLANAA